MAASAAFNDEWADPTVEDLASLNVAVAALRRLGVRFDERFLAQLNAVTAPHRYTEESADC